MRKCPKCGKICDDTWKVCLNCPNTQLEDFAGPIPKEKPVQEEWFNKDNWEEALQEKLAGEMSISKTELVEVLKKRPYPRWVRLYSIGIGIIVVIALLFSIPYFGAAIYLEKYYKARKSGNWEAAFNYLGKSIRLAPNAKKSQMEYIILGYAFEEDKDVEDSINLIDSLPFTPEEKTSLKNGGAQLRKKIEALQKKLETQQ